ncbi:MAG: aspartate ammonia-lyase, partial [Brachybacterium sp.]
RRSIGVVTALVPVIGYAAATDVAATALDTGRPVAELVLERGLLDEARLNSLLSPASMTRPHRATPTGSLPAVSQKWLDSGEIARLPEEPLTEG